MFEDRADGGTAQNADHSISRKSDEASGAAEVGSKQHSGSSSSTSQARSSMQCYCTHMTENQAQKKGEVISGSMLVESLKKKHKGSTNTGVVA